jgi:hypothetical protein
LHVFIPYGIFIKLFRKFFGLGKINEKLERRREEEVLWQKRWKKAK